MKSRLFISLDLPDKVVEKIISLRNTVTVDGNVKWEPRDKLHLTIRFIGDVSNDIVDKISNELLFINDFSWIKCSFNKFGFFYHNDNPIILWAGLNTNELLNHLVVELNSKLIKFSIPIEKREFNPHITLLRLKNVPGINFVNNFKNFTFEPILFYASTITLYKSILHSKGSEYIKIKNYKLKELE